MSSRNTPSSPPAEDVQENPQSSEALQADESFGTAPTPFAFSFSGPAPANTVVVNAPRRGPNEADVDDNLNAEFYDPATDPYWPRQARQATRPRARSFDITSTRRAPGMLDDRANTSETATAWPQLGTDPRAGQPTQFQQQLVQVQAQAGTNYLPLPAYLRVRQGGHVPRGAGLRPNAGPRSLSSARGNVDQRGGLPNIDRPLYVSPQEFPAYMDPRPTRFEDQSEQGAAFYQPPRPQRTPRTQGTGPQPVQVQRRPQSHGLSQQQRGQQAGGSIVPPSEMMRRIQNSQQQGQQGNLIGAPYAAQIQQGYPPQGPRLPMSPYLVGSAQALQGPVLQSTPAPGNINRGPASAYGPGYYPGRNARDATGIAEFIASRRAPPQVVPAGPLRPLQRDPPRPTQPRHQRIGEEAAEMHRKRRRQAEDESDDESGDEALMEAKTRRRADEDEDEDDEDEDQGGPAKESSRNTKPAKKKAKGSSKKGARAKSQPTKRAPKTRIDHGELDQRADGSIWFRAYESAAWEPTVRHEDSRREMLADARRDPANPNGPGLEYDVEPRAGDGDHNRTSYLEAHRHWYCEGRHNWHHQTLDPIFYRFQRGDRPFRVDAVGPLRWRGYVVLNSNNEVITGWPDMPLTLSQKIEGWRMEAITRLDERISAEDFRDRMPRRKTRGREEKAPQGASALGNHRSRFREENGLASWDARDGTSGYTEAIRSRLTAEQRANNTTQGFDRLSDDTIKNVRDQNRKNAKGSYAKRAGHKALTEQERAARAAGAKPTRTKMTSRPPKKTQEAPADEPSPDPESSADDGQESSPEDDGEDEEEPGYDSDVDDSAA
ncbi:MAG: hypothetical protein Q9195_001172 [Heterodermia aff. obscurata]